MQYFNAKQPHRTHLTIRDIKTSDLAAVTDIYNHYVTHTVITFDIETFTTEQRLPWLAQFAPQTRHQCLIIENNG